MEVVGSTVRVVDTEGLKIDELVGNVAGGGDEISIASVSAAAGAAEPWLTLHYDEWICVLRGRCVLSVGGGAEDLVVEAGRAVRIAKGTRFRPRFPVDTEYVPVCVPAFRPDRCVREDDTEEGARVAGRLASLHGGGAAAEAAEAAEAPPEVLYHMTTVAEWEAARAAGVYYPKTYEQDGFYTHATGVPSRLLATANHFYRDVPGDWVCLRFTRSALRAAGIHVRDEEAMPVGDKPVDDSWRSAWICPHVIGGIPAAVVDAEFAMTRSGTEFTGIDELC